MADGTIADSKRQIANGQALWPAFLLSALLLLSSYPYLRVEMREPTVEQGPVSYAALMRFQRTSDEMTGVTAWVDAQKRPIWSDMADLWVQGKPVTTRVDYSQVPQNKTLAVNSEDVGSAHEQVYWYAEGPGKSITFNRFWYPGWTAWLLDGKDGRPCGSCRWNAKTAHWRASSCLCPPARATSCSASRIHPCGPPRNGSRW